MFDLPVDTKKARRAYTRFRKALLAEGFQMLQFSVYARYCASEERSRTFCRRIRVWLPAQGQVRLVAVTDKQFGKMVIFEGRKRRKAESAPQQLALF